MTVGTAAIGVGALSASARSGEHSLLAAGLLTVAAVHSFAIGVALALDWRHMIRYLRAMTRVYRIRWRRLAWTCPELSRRTWRILASILAAGGVWTGWLALVAFRWWTET